MSRMRCIVFATWAAVVLPSALSLAQTNQAEFHYKVALAALKDDNLDIALKELQEAARLAPANALIQFNIAVVEDKKGDHTRAMDSLRRALTLGLPGELQAQADELRATLTYQNQKRLTTIVGNWQGKIHFSSTNVVSFDYAFDMAGGFQASTLYLRGDRVCGSGRQRGTYRVDTDGGGLLMQLNGRVQSVSCGSEYDMAAVIGGLPFTVNEPKSSRKTLPYVVKDLSTVILGRASDLTLTRTHGTADEELRRGTRRVGMSPLPGEVESETAASVKALCEYIGPVGTTEFTVLETLVKAVPNLNVKCGDLPPLHLLLRRYVWPKAIALLVSHGADVNAAEEELHMTAIFSEASDCEPENVRALLEAGADWRIKDNNYKKDALGVAKAHRGIKVSDEQHARCKATVSVLESWIASHR